MRKIAIINQKGGVGKTTTTANLGAALARAGRRVLLLDFDPQGHLTLHFGIRLADDQANSYDVLTDDVSVAEASIEINDRLTLVPADINLAGAESELVSVTGREVLLKEALIPVEDLYDYLLIDCPPSVGVLTVNALSAVDELLIPMQTQFFALQGFGKLLEKTVTLVQRRINSALTVTGVALCMHEASTRLAGEVVEDLREFLEASRSMDVAWACAKIFDATIRRNIKLAEACSFGQSIFEYAPKSNGAADYLRLAVEVFPEAGIELPHWMARDVKRRRKDAASENSTDVPSTSRPLAGADGQTMAHQSTRTSAVDPLVEHSEKAAPPPPTAPQPTAPQPTVTPLGPRIVRVIDARLSDASADRVVDSAVKSAADATRAGLVREPAPQAADSPSWRLDPQPCDPPSGLQVAPELVENPNPSMAKSIVD